MQAPQPSISGTRDYTGDDALALRTARDAIEATLRSYAYAAVDPPILESSSPFLNRSGEDIRRHMYIFPDPGGKEVCLRPELTIPVCRAYLRQLQMADDGQSAADREARLCYFGPAFRYESASEGRYRQFYQAGAEFIGATSREAADAEILAVALDALDVAGIKNPPIEIGDVDILNGFIDQLPVTDRSKTRIRRLALQNRKDARIVTASSAKDTNSTGDTNGFGELASLLAAVEPGKAELLLKEMLALADIRHVGGRTAEEIVERLASRTAQHGAEPISAELIEGVTELMNIRGKPASAFAAVRKHFRTFGLGSADAILDRCESRLRFFDAYRQRPAKLEFNVGLRRGLEYYTGFLFEIFAPGLAQIGPVCGGGRYDNLLEGLGASAPIPAVGFAIGLDRLLMARQKSSVAGVNEMPAPQALVVATGAQSGEECIRVSAALRKAAWSVETDFSARAARSVVAYAAKRRIPYVVFVDQNELKKGKIRIRRPNDRNDQLVALDEFAKDGLGESGNPSKSAAAKS